MTEDTIFRIYSMSKPITTVAAMMLVEEGRRALEEPVSKYIPSFSSVKVGMENKTDDGGGDLDLVPPRKPDHHPGFDAPYVWHNLRLFRRRRGQEGLCRRACIPRRFRQRGIRRAHCEMPLAYQPGTTWDYNHSTDILGASSKSLAVSRALCGAQRSAI